MSKTKKTRKNQRLKDDLKRVAASLEKNTAKRVSSEELKPSNDSETAVTVSSSPNKENSEKQEQARSKAEEEAKRSQAIIISSFAFLGFLLAFVANYGFFDMAKALNAGFWGLGAGALTGYLPYSFKSRI